MTYLPRLPPAHYDPAIAHKQHQSGPWMSICVGDVAGFARFLSSADEALANVFWVILFIVFIFESNVGRLAVSKFPTCV
jgi:hypothetical protein